MIKKFNDFILESIQSETEIYIEDIILNYFENLVNSVNDIEIIEHNNRQYEIIIDLKDYIATDDFVDIPPKPGIYGYISTGIEKRFSLMGFSTSISMPFTNVSTDNKMMVNQIIIRLKQFKKVLEEDVDYEKISCDEYDKYYNKIKFSKLDIFELINFFNGKNIPKLNPPTIRGNMKWYSINKERIDIGSNNSRISIQKYDDEYYTLSLNLYTTKWINRYYKCDQIDGVIELLNDISSECKLN